MSDTSMKRKYKINDDPPVVTEDVEAAQAAKELGYEVTEINNE